MPKPLLFQQISPADEAQAALTKRHLGVLAEALPAYFLALRAETDAALSLVLPIGQSFWAKLPGNPSHPQPFPL